MLADNIKQDQLCEICKSEAAVVKEVFPLYKDELKPFCRLFSPELTEKCEGLVEEFAATLKNITPEQICQMMSVCKGSSLAGKLGL